MTPDQLRRKQAERWLAVANKDIHSAELLAEEEPSNSLFHSQQAAEKAAKGFLTFHNVPFRKTHDMEELGNQCGEVDASLAPLFQAAGDLTDYAVTFRYLDAPREPDHVEAIAAIDLARQLCDAVRSRLNVGPAPPDLQAPEVIVPPMPPEDLAD